MSIKVRRIDFSPDEWIAGTAGLSVEEEGLYIRICALIWSRGGRITYGVLRASIVLHGNKLNALLDSLEGSGKIVRDGAEIGQRRAEKELANAERRIGKARENGAKGGRPNGLTKPGGLSDAALRMIRKKAKPSGLETASEPENGRDSTDDGSEINGLSKPPGLSAAALRIIRKKVGNGREIVQKTDQYRLKSIRYENLNYQLSGKEELAPYEANSVLSRRATTSTPPLPSRGDGDADAASRQAEPDAPTVFTDPALKADAIAAFGRCLDAIRGKPPILDAEAPPPPDPRLVEFRARLVRLNALAGECLDGNTRMQAWEIIAAADELGDPHALSPAMLADLAAIERLEAYAEAAE